MNFILIICAFFDSWPLEYVCVCNLCMCLVLPCSELTVPHFEAKRPVSN